MRSGTSICGAGLFRHAAEPGRGVPEHVGEAVGRGVSGDGGSDAAWGDEAGHGEPVWGKTAEFPQGCIERVFRASSRSSGASLGMDKMLEAIGDEVHVTVSFEGTHK